MPDHRTRLRIGVAVHGRFHAFELALGLLQNGHEVTLFTNYPRAVAARFGVPAERVRSLVSHGVAARLGNRMAGGQADRWLNPWFGGWAAHNLAREALDLVHIWSGVAGEWLGHAAARQSRNVLARGSAHIRTQRRLLDEEEARVGVPLHKPSDWTIEREEQEYESADLIVVPSRFAYETFLHEGVAAERLRRVVLAGAASRFQASPAVVQARTERIERGQPLRVLFVGAVSYQKGMFDLLQVMESLPAARFHFRLVGTLTAECAARRPRLAERAELIGRVPESELPAHYAWADLHVLPSIQDGFAVVLSQAAASGVPFIASAHSGGPDLVDAGVPGWILPARAPAQWAALLCALDEDRAQLATRARATAGAAQSRDWRAVAHDLIGAVAP
ncbi:MAG: glycosyltransferase family 4 protein [Longimicrobiales bacterium]